MKLQTFTKKELFTEIITLLDSKQYWCFVTDVAGSRITERIEHKFYKTAAKNRDFHVFSLAVPFGGVETVRLYHFAAKKHLSRRDLFKTLGKLDLEITYPPKDSDIIALCESPNVALEFLTQLDAFKRAQAAVFN